MTNETRLRKAFDKKDFDAGASGLKIALWYFTSMFFFRSGLIPFSSILVFILRLFGSKIGKEVRIKPYIHIYYPWKLTIGDYSWLSECRIENLAPVIIGKNVCISQKAMLLTGNHDYKKVGFDLITSPINLEDGVWIGASSIVCPGVIAKSHSILTVGSTASQNLDPYTVYKGNPAVAVKNRIISP